MYPHPKQKELPCPVPQEDCSQPCCCHHAGVWAGLPSRAVVLLQSPVFPRAHPGAGTQAVGGTSQLRTSMSPQLLLARWPICATGHQASSGAHSRCHLEPEFLSLAHKFIAEDLADRPCPTRSPHIHAWPSSLSTTLYMYPRVPACLCRGPDSQLLVPCSSSLKHWGLSLPCNQLERFLGQLRQTLYALALGLS